MESGQISDYGFLADGRSAALVDAAGSVNWWCPGRFDAPSVFGRLLDDDAGHWSIRPEVDFTVERSYLEDTLVLRTVFRTAQGEVALTDALAFEPGSRGHDIGMHPPQVLVRSVQGLSGAVPMRVHYRPRFEYGRTIAYLVEREDMLEAIAGAARLTFRGSVRLACGDDGDAAATFTVRAGTTHNFTLGYAPTYDAPLPEVPDADQTIADTVAGWRSWAAEHDYQGLYAEEVRRSGLVVQGMTYRPSGAVVASVTTSLPEKLGGDRNYDYRYVWVRDFSHTLRALWRSACFDEVRRQFAWLGRAMGRVGDQPVPIMYGVLGERDLTEHRLDQLGGYRDSPPVVTGNDAWRQRQNDIYGAAMDAAWLMRDQLEPFDSGRLPPAPGARRSGRAGLETAGRGDVGGAWSATPPRVLEGGVLGRAGPGGPLRRPARRAAGPGPLDGGPGRGARGDPRAGVERPAPVVHRDFRFRRAGRVGAGDAAGGFSAGR